MPSEADFLNDALSQIGASRITGIDDGSLNANYCSTFWPALRRSLLRSHHWNFAEARIALAQGATVPAFEFAYAYPLPADLLKVKEYNGANLSTVTPTRFKIEGRTLLSNDGTVQIVYVKDVVDPTLWDGLFYQAAAAWLASKLASAITKDVRLAAAKLQEATLVLMPLALAVDGQEQTDQPFIVDDLLYGR